VGREKEVRQLKALLEEIHQKGGRMVLIHGEAGVGKTRLMGELRQVVERKGGTVLIGRCHEETRSIPYYPFREAFRHLFEARKEEVLPFLENLPEYFQWELTRLLPGLREMEPAELERAPDPFRLFESVRLLLSNVGAYSNTPLLFIIEDLHWSDEATLDLLHYLTRNLRSGQTGMSVLLCGTYRTEEVEEDARFMRVTGTLRKEGLFEEISLKPLSAEGVSAMLRLLYPGMKVPQDSQGFLYEKTDGNPFFVEEVLRSLKEGEIVEGLSKIEDIPQSIHAVLQRRMDGLSPERREVLACGALVGKEFEFEVIERVLDRPQGEILDGIEAGMKSQIVRESFTGEGERYRFAHALTADVLYSGIGKTRRRLWHGRVGEALEDVYAGRLAQLNGQLAYHFERGEKWGKALDYALKSAKQAKEDYANQEAIRLYEKAREILPRLHVGRTLLSVIQENIIIANGLGDVYRITGEYEKALKEYQLMEESARRQEDKKIEGKALDKRGQVYRLQGNYDQAMAVGERSKEICQKIGDQKGVGTSLNNIGNVYLNRGDYDEALKCFKESLTITREIGDKSGIAVSLNNIGNVNRIQGNYDEALKCFEESLTIRREIGDKSGIAVSLGNIGNVHWRRGDYGDALKSFEESLMVGREIGDKRNVAVSLGNIGNVHWRRGDYGKALKCFEEFLTITREIGDKSGIAVSLGNIGNVHWRRGDYGEALKSFEESLMIGREIGDKRDVAVSLGNIGNVHWRRGDYGKALKCADESLLIRREIGDKRGVIYNLTDKGNFHRVLYDFGKSLEYQKEALTLTEEMEAMAEKAWVLSEIGTNYQLLGDNEYALQYLNDALERVVDLGLKEVEPEVLESLCKVWLSKGDSEKADEFCERMLKMAEKVGIKDYIARGKKIRGEILTAKAVAVGSSSEKTVAVAESSSSLKIDKIKEAETELKEALRIAEEIGASPLLWQIHASLGRLYSTNPEPHVVQGGQKAKEQFSKAKEIIQGIASKIGDEKLKNTFLTAKPVRSILELSL
jgi:tetratricopeptide (TPR) repeat protein